MAGTGHARSISLGNRTVWRVASAAMIASSMTGCAGSGDVSTAALPGLPALPKISLPEAPPPVVGSATEVYERIGRGAMACWFGANGSLKATHIYDATAEPENKGGRAEILIREREAQGESPRGVKAFRILITPSTSEETMVLAENLKLPEAAAEGMKKSVAAWSIGNQGCDPDAVKGAWQPEAEAGKTAGEKQKATRPEGQAAKSKP